MRRLLTLIFIVGAFCGSSGQEPVLGRYVGVELVPVLQALERANASGSLIFSGRCPEGYTPDLPPFRSTSSGGLSTLDTLRKLLPDHSPLQVTRDEKGLIRILDPSAPDDILSVRISHIAFDGSGTPWTGADYRPGDAVHRIVRSPEVMAFAKAHQLQSPLLSNAGRSVTGNMKGHWPPDQARISGSLDNVTVAQALDHVLRTFPGLWVYENCPAPTDRALHFWVGYFHLDHWGAQAVATQ